MSREVILGSPFNYRLLAVIHYFPNGEIRCELTLINGSRKARFIAVRAKELPGRGDYYLLAVSLKDYAG